MVRTPFRRAVASARPLFVAALVALLVVLMPTVMTERRADAAGPTVTCGTDANIFSTGYDATTGTILGNGKEDANWETTGPYGPTSPPTQVSLPPANAVWQKAIVGNAAPGFWSASPYGNAQWIAKESSSPTGDWYYRFRFTLDPGVQPSDFALSLSFLADNSVAEVFVNDVAQSSKTEGLPQDTADPYQYVGYTIDKASKTFLNSDWRTGDNTIIVQIKSGSPAEGFLAQVRPSTLCPRPAIKLRKSVNPTGVMAAGQTVTYSFEVTNIGNQPLTGVAVTETAFTGKGAAPTVSCPAAVLAIEEVMTCTAQYTVTPEEYAAAKPTGLFEITNTATASGTPPTGPTVTSEPASKTLSVRHAGIKIVKATTKAFVTEVGEQVPYTFTVTNTVPLLALLNVTVTDPKVGTVTCPAFTAARLGAGKSMECTGTYTVTQTDLDAGRIINAATASGVAGQKTLSEVSNEVVVPALYDPGLSIVKATTTTSFNAVGAQIPYTFTVTNTGNITIGNLAISDPKIANPVCPLTELKPGERTICTGNYTSTQADVDAGHIVNQAAATGRTPAGADVTAPSNRQVITANPRPELSIVKSTPVTFYDKVGQPIGYTFLVTNTGNQNVSNVTVTDPRLGGTVCTIPQLAPGAQSPCTGTHTTTAANLDAARITNQAVARGTSPANQPVTATSNLVVVPAVHSPQLTLVKASSSPGPESIGAKIPYEFTVTNTGNVTVDNVKISDPRVPAVVCPATKLAIGERMTCEATYTVTQADLDAEQVVNQATVDGDVPSSGRKLGPTPSNEVIIRSATATDDTDVLGSGPPGGPAGTLPRTGRQVPTELRAAAGLLLLGVALMTAVRYRSV